MRGGLRRGTVGRCWRLAAMPRIINIAWMRANAAPWPTLSAAGMAWLAVRKAITSLLVASPYTRSCRKEAGEQVAGACYHVWG